MSNNQRVSEKRLYDIWKDQELLKELKTVSGEDVSVLNVGEMDLSISGPDFKNARIRIGNFTYVGDIEIDGDYKDWKHHGHNIDNKYNKVVLHASLLNKFNQPYVYTKDGRKIPTVCLAEHLPEEVITNLSKKMVLPENGDSLKCAFANSEVDIQIKKDVLLELGIERFKRKCKRVYNRLKELEYLRQLNIKEPVITYDLTPEFEKKEFSHEDFKHRIIWEQVFLELIFEALGYSKNKGIMLNVAHSANMEFFHSIEEKENFISIAEAALFHIGGLVSDNGTDTGKDVSDYVDNLNKNWDKIKGKYDGETYDETQWHFFKLRPQNFPTIRLSAGARFINEMVNKDLIGVIIKKITEIRNVTVLVNSIRSLFVMRSKGFWSKHYVLDKPAQNDIKYFVGAARADEIVINVVLPFFAVYFELFGQKETSKKVFKLYNIYIQKSDNKIVRDVAENLNMNDYLKKTIYAQGMIELFRNFCSKNKCLECAIGKEVFA